MTGVDTVVFDGIITQRIVDIAADKSIKRIVASRVSEAVKPALNVELMTFQTVIPTKPKNNQLGFCFFFSFVSFQSSFSVTLKNQVYLLLQATPDLLYNNQHLLLRFWRKHRASHAIQSAPFQQK